MKIGALIFSRYSSTRLPGKALVDIGGRELLGRVIDRAKMIDCSGGVAVATSLQSDDDKIADFALANHVPVFRGDLTDVAYRAISACRFFGWDGFIRICGDRPFLNASIIDFALQVVNEVDADLITTNGEYTLPPGLTTEIVMVDELERQYQYFSNHHKEHLTAYYYENEYKFSIHRINFPSISFNLYPTKLVVDDGVDLLRAESVIEAFGEQISTSPSFLLELLDFAVNWDESHKQNLTFKE